MMLIVWMCLLLLIFKLLGVSVKLGCSRCISSVCCCGVLGGEVLFSILRNLMLLVVLLCLMICRWCLL